MEGIRQMINTNVLLVTDGAEVGGMWAHGLTQKGVAIMLADSAEAALGYVDREMIDLIIIDVYTPQLDGIELGHQLRSQVISPILLLSYDSDEPNMLAAYQAGIDDYMVKPISPPLFLAKVEAWLRRAWMVPAVAFDTSSFQVGKLCLDPARRQIVTPAGCTVQLTKLEFRLLSLLANHQGQVIETNLIIDRVWGFVSSDDYSLVKNVVYRLRQKIEPDPRNPSYILTVAGEGYTFQSN
jgi:two-component system, OmpR family, alkaline phosphatase synthesis response regulator PhoP